MKSIGDWLALYLQRHPVVLRDSLRFLKDFFPVQSRKLVMGADAVREVFNRPQDFLLGYLNAPKLKTGPFLLGMDPGTRFPSDASRHAREKAILVDALQGSLEKLPNIVLAESKHVISELIGSASGQATSLKVLELGSGYAERVYTRAFARYFGLPLTDTTQPRSAHLDTEPGEATLTLLIRTVGAAIGSAHPAPFGLEKLAKAVAPELTSYLAAVVRAHRDGKHPDLADTVIGRLGAQIDKFADGEAGIVRCVAGMLAAGASFSKVFTGVLDELLRHGQLESLQRAVERRDQAKVLDYVLEAMRFRPPFPMLVRYCPRDTVLHGAATDPNTDIAAGSTLAFFPIGAMFDPARVESPEDFVAGRPHDVYMLFGTGPRECIARPLIQEFFLPMFCVLFDHADFVAARPGKFRFDSVALESYRIQPLTVSATPRGKCPMRAKASPAAEVPDRSQPSITAGA